ncbi:hypothetical protein OPQ81_006730 [Rhizoctonia solani]|nr:hypothetical protein OPQ81_006730 [Rhizoctonia solani]
MPRKRQSAGRNIGLELRVEVKVVLKKAPATPPQTPTPCTPEEAETTLTSFSGVQDDSGLKTPEAEAKSLHYQAPKRPSKTQFLPTPPNSDHKHLSKSLLPLVEPASPSTRRARRKQRAGSQQQSDTPDLNFTVEEAISDPALSSSATAPLSGLRSPTIPYTPLHDPINRSTTPRIPGEYPTSPPPNRSSIDSDEERTSIDSDEEGSSIDSDNSSAAQASDVNKRSSNRCCAITKAGRQCLKQARPASDLALLCYAARVQAERYCRQHIGLVLKPTGFHSRANNTWVSFSKLVPSYLQPGTQAALRADMENYVSESDKDGYIYAFEIMDPETPNEFHIKVGRSVNFIKRLDDWRKQCPSRKFALRGWWPGTIEKNNSANGSSLLGGRINPGKKAKYSHRLERLIHLELSDIALNSTHLTPRFNREASDQENTDINSDTSTALPSSKLEKKSCPDCDQKHKEIFTLQRVTTGEMKGREWECIVMPIIEKWGKFVVEHASKKP